MSILSIFINTFYTIVKFQQYDGRAYGGIPLPPSRNKLVWRSRDLNTHILLKTWMTSLNQPKNLIEVDSFD